MSIGQAKIIIKDETASRSSVLLWQVRRSIRFLKLKELGGTWRIILMDSSPETAFDNGSSGGKRLGFYLQSESSRSLATIELYLDPIIDGIPKIFWLSTVPMILITKTLSHEVAHHLHLDRKRSVLSKLKTKDPEEVAKQFAAKILLQMRNSWKYFIGFWLIKELAFYYYCQGIFAFEKHKYSLSANHYFNAWRLDTTLYEVAERHWAAKEREKVV